MGGADFFWLLMISWCSVCRQKWEQMLPDPSAGAPPCPSCGSGAAVRLFPAPHVAKNQEPAPGRTCCGREERCTTPGCSTGRGCRRV